MVANHLRIITKRAEFTRLEHEVLCELIRLHARVLKRMPWVQTLLVIGVVILLFSSTPKGILLGWSLSTISLECLRALYAVRLLKLDTILNPRAIHRRLILLAAVVAASIGLAAMVFIPLIPLADQALMMIMFFTLPAAGVSVSVSSQPILAAYALFILAPAATSWGLQYPSQTVTVAGLTTLYWWFIISVAGDGEQLLRRSVAIRCERDRVVQDLKTRNLEVREAVAKAEHSSKARARVLAAASHDLRQPLHALSVYSAVLNSNPSLETLPKVASNIDRLVRVLGDLLHGLLDLSRLSTEYYVPEQQRVSLERLVGEVCNEYEADAKNKNLRLVRDLQPIRLFDDPVAIARITRNLLDNALKYTDQGEIRVLTRINDQQALLIIEDTGRGIPANEQNRIFEEFYQLDNPGRDHEKGVGLGLAIVHRLCELIGASIALKSVPGKGATFTVTFHSIATDSIPKNPSESLDSSALTDKLVFIVDDEIDILDSMNTLLRSWALRVITAQSAQSLETLFEQHGKPDLLIADLRLRGDEQGAQLVKRLRQRHGDFQVLIVTGETATDELLQANAAGYPILQKPINCDELFEMICKLLEQ
jgi:signal transduction histidine kinase